MCDLVVLECAVVVGVGVCFVWRGNCEVELRGADKRCALHSEAVAGAGVAGGFAGRQDGTHPRQLRGVPQPQLTRRRRSSGASQEAAAHHVQVTRKAIDTRVVFVIAAVIKEALPRI